MDGTWTVGSSATEQIAGALAALGRESYLVKWRLTSAQRSLASVGTGDAGICLEGLLVTASQDTNRSVVCFICLA